MHAKLTVSTTPTEEAFASDNDVTKLDPKDKKLHDLEEVVVLEDHLSEEDQRLFHEMLANHSDYFEGQCSNHDKEVTDFGLEKKGSSCMKHIHAKFYALAWKMSRN